VILALLSFLAFADDPESGSSPATGMPAPPHRAVVTSVYDGDTFTLSTGDKVRLKWVNTPEMKPLEPFAQEAKELTQSFVAGQEVELLFTGVNPRDSYGRLVAGARTAEGNLSEALLRAGLAHLFVIPPDDTDITPLIAAQEEARQARRGIWGSDTFQGTFHLTSFHANAPGDDNLNVNGEYLRICNVTSQPASLEGWRLVNDAGNTFRFPGVVIPAGHTARVMSGKGASGPDAIGKIEVYLGSDVPIWSNEGDKAQLYDPQGIRRDLREHHGSASH
jgi:endonuclease YncB( thermonuclease family)